MNGRNIVGRRSSFCILPCLIAALTLHSAAAAPPDPCMEDSKCKDLVESARLLSKSEKYEAALAIYQAAYERQAVPWLLVNIGRVQQKLGHKEQALVSFRRYLNHPAASQDELTRARATEFLQQIDEKHADKISASDPQKSVAKKLETTAVSPPSKLDDAAIVGPPVVSEKLRIAQGYLREKNWREALRSASNPLLMDAAPEDTLRIIGVSACNLRDLTRAQSSYTKLKQAGSKSSQDIVARSCIDNDVMLVDDSLLHAEKLLAAGDYQAALHLIEGDRRPDFLPPRAWRVIGIAACRLKDSARTKLAMAAMDDEGRQAVASACQPATLGQKLRLAEAQLHEKSWREALRSASDPSLMKDAPEQALRIVGVAACNLRDLNRAQTCYAKLKEFGSVAGLESITNACRQNNVLLPEDDSFKAEKLLRAGDYQAALRVVESAKTHDLFAQRDWRVVGLSACHLKDSIRAKLAFEALDSRGKYEVEEACSIAGIQLEERPAVSAQAAAKALSQAWIHYRQNRLPQALVAAREAVDGHRQEAWTVIGLASCRIEDLPKVNEAYRNATPDGRQQIQTTCGLQHIVLTDQGRFVQASQ